MIVRLYLDEDAMKKALVSALRARGLDVLTAHEAAMIERPDEDHLAFAAAEGRVLYSFNVADYCRLHAQGRPHFGLLLAQQQRYSVSSVSSSPARMTYRGLAPATQRRANSEMALLPQYLRVVARPVSAQWRTLQQILTLARSFTNWPSVWLATRGRTTLPPLVLRCGLTVHHEPGDDPLFLFREIFLEHCYVHDDFYLPDPGDTVLDVGANIGMFMLYLQSRARGIRVHCFEPASSTRRCLMRNVETNHLERYVSVHEVAVSGTRGMAHLKAAPMSGQRSFFASQFVYPDRQESVRCVPLDEALEACATPTVDLLKVDVEGAEIDIFEGATPAMWSRVRRVSVEFHDLIRPGCRDRVTRVLRAQGFHDIRTETVPPMGTLGVIQARR